MDEPPKPKRRRRWFWRGLIGFVVLAVVAELVLRFGVGLGHPPLMQADPQIGYLFKANQNLRRFDHSVIVNEWHQRSAPTTRLPAPGTRRVLCLGDSVTWGGVLSDQSETYPELLANELRSRHPGTAWETLNASAGSWAPGNERAYLERFGTFGSAVVVLQIGSHDLTQSPSTGEIIGKSVFMPDREPLCALTEAFSRYLMPRLQRYMPDSTPPNPTVPPDDSAQFETNLKDIQAMTDLARAAKAVVVVVHTPDRDEVALPTAERPTRYNPFRQRFLDSCAARGVPVIDLVAEWGRDPAAASYFRDVVHPNPEGNRAIARALAATIHDTAFAEKP